MSTEKLVSAIERVQRTGIDGESVSDKERLKRLQFATDEYGGRLMSSDPDYRSYVEGEIKRSYTGSSQTVLNPKYTTTDNP